ncbi:SDR family oxidoreductase [Peribacillus tepidiphilus]|uniref:SDR family oxidoreductase n=1 Tax=Peribacillus tepidiphilus TaxID=2652445 RepID=UPI0035B53B2A
MELGLKGKTALVVASSQGLGKAIAEELLIEGAKVMLVGREKNKLQRVKEKFSSYGEENVEYVEADITKPDQIKKMVQKTIDVFGGIHILVNNAGGPPAGSFEDMTDEMWQKAFELNLLSYIRIIREALPYLKQQGGKIINIASSSIKEPIPGLILSNTFRTGIVGLSKTLALEFAPYGILINTVAPGRISTDRVRHLDQVNADKKGVSREEIEEAVKATIPLGRYGEPQEFAKFVTFLASEANSYVTGSAFLIDGGMVKSI